ncbi:MAG: UPF0175 family protein [Acidobacteria bacterium]|jgi:predicted HTH domain antitoxin|nr:UPF0175 family protein [Acidobacteriota bacterium]
MQVTINIPEDLAKLIGTDQADIERRVLTATVLEEYRCGRLSHGQIGKLLGMNRFQVDAFLKDNNVPLNYSIKDLEDDRRTLDELALKR